MGGVLKQDTAGLNRRFVIGGNGPRRYVGFRQAGPKASGQVGVVHRTDDQRSGVGAVGSPHHVLGGQQGFGHAGAGQEGPGYLPPGPGDGIQGDGAGAGVRRHIQADDHAQVAVDQPRKPQGGIQEDGAFQFGIGETGPPQVGPGQVGQLQGGGGQVGAPQVGARQVSPGKVGVGQVGAGEVGPLQVDVLEVGVAQVGAGELGLDQVAAGEIAPDEGAPGHVGQGQVGVGKVGPGYVGRLQIGPHQAGILEVGAGQVGPAEIVVGQVRPGQPDPAQVGAGQVQLGPSVDEIPFEGLPGGTVSQAVVEVVDDGLFVGNPKGCFSPTGYGIGAGLRNGDVFRICQGASWAMRPGRDITTRSFGGVYDTPKGRVREAGKGSIVGTMPRQGFWAAGTFSPQRRGERGVARRISALLCVLCASVVRETPGMRRL